MRAVHNRCFFVEILSLYQHTLELVLDVFILNIHFSSNVPEKSFFNKIISNNEIILNHSQNWNDLRTKIIFLMIMLSHIFNSRKKKCHPNILFITTIILLIVYFKMYVNIYSLHKSIVFFITKVDKMFIRNFYLFYKKMYRKICYHYLVSSLKPQLKIKRCVSKWRIIKLVYETDVSTALWTQIICSLSKLTIHMFQNAEPILQAKANDNELHRLQVNIIEGPNSQSTTGENEETIPQNVADGIKEHSPKSNWLHNLEMIVQCKSYISENKKRQVTNNFMAIQ